MYVIYLSSEEEKYDSLGTNPYGYWLGQIYKAGDLEYPNCLSYKDDLGKELKIYTSKKRAENMAKKILERCFYVRYYRIEEL